jgi:tetratricopeptide (TPR) repeat protein
MSQLGLPSFGIREERRVGSLQTFLIFVSAMIAQADSAQADAAQQPKISQPAIAVAIEQLGADTFEVRQRATDFLWQAGRDAKSALKLAAQSSDLEVSFRAKSILEDFRFGLFAETPEDVAKLVRRYRREQGRTRELLWGQILKLAPSETLVAMSNAEPNAKRRRHILSRLERDGDIEFAVSLAEQWRDSYVSPDEPARLNEFIRKQVPFYLAKRQFRKSESILEQSATDGPGIRNWAAYLLLQGKLDAKIDKLRGEVASSKDDQDELRIKLVHMLRVRGDVDDALAVARQLSNPDGALLRGLLFDLRQWGELAARQSDVLDLATSNARVDIEALGFAAAYNRLIGNKTAFTKHISSIREYAKQHDSGSKIEYCREAMFLNGFTDEAIQLLAREESVDAFNVQITRGQYFDAFETAGIGATRESRDAWLQGVLQRPDGSIQWKTNFQIATRLAQVLATTGEKEESLEMFDRLAGSIRNNRDATQMRQLAAAEVRAKMIDQAFEHAAAAFDKDRNSASISVPFTNHRTAAKTWWDIFIALDPSETTRERLARIRRLFFRSSKRTEVLDAIVATHARVRSLAPENRSRDKWLHAIGETYLLHQDEEAARQCFESIAKDHTPAAIRMGDLLRKEEQWGAAAKWYVDAWEHGDEPYTLYLQGEMLSKAGQNDAGTAAKRLARLLPLAGASRYDGLASPLAQRGFADVAQQECELLRRCSTWSDLSMFFAIASLEQAVKAEDPLRAAAYSEQRMLNCLQENWHFTDQASYVRIPFEVHRLRATGLMDQQKVNQAIAELQMCQQIWPGELNLPEAFVPRLDEAGKTEAADKLFARTYDLVEETCEMFPNSAMHHNNAAWLAAKCKRRLDEALSHVNRALELVPGEAQYIDTQGEVYFQLGDIDAAINCAKQCVKIDPQTNFYKEQLARFQAAKKQP